MARKRNLRVYLQTHHDGRLSGLLLPARLPVPAPPPSAYGSTEAEVLDRLEVHAAVRLAEDAGALDPYLWETPLEVHSLSVEVHPGTTKDKRPVIGAARLPLKLTYAASKLKGGAWQILAPRFGWSFVVEELSIAKDVLRQAVSTALVGEQPRSLFDFRCEGEEYVREWELPGVGRRRVAAAEPREPLPTVEAVAEDLTERAARGKLPPLVPLDSPIGESWVVNLLKRRPAASLLLVGGPGVGKSTWVLHLAQWLVDRKRQAKDQEHTPRLWKTSAERIIAGMVYLGMWQERCLAIAEELGHEGDLLFVDRLASLVAPQPDGASIADLLVREARAGSLSLIAECTEEELERCRRRAPDVVDAFVQVRLPEPAPMRMPELMARYLSSRHAAVSIHPAGMAQLVNLLATFRRDSLFPGKAYRFLDWLQAQADPARPRTLYPKDAAEAYARYSGLPLEIISDEVAADRGTLAAMLRRGVIGQDAACESCAGVLARLKVGLNDPAKPVGAMLFVGPTGVGKTELAKQLARVLFGHEDRMIRLDMSEYQLPGSSRRLLEVGPGVSSLAERVRQQPLCLVLLDEIEKAHPEVFDLLLGVLGEGRLTDSLGRAVDFRMALVVMTSNLGVTDGDPTGFGAETVAADHLRGVREAFRPEFFNRLDHVLAFRRLGRDDVRRIVELELAKVAARVGLTRRNLQLRADTAAREWLADHGFDPKLGARPLKRLIEEKVVAPLSIRLSAEGGLRGRSIVVVAGAAGLASLDAQERELAIVLEPG